MFWPSTPVHLPTESKKGLAILRSSDYSFAFVSGGISTVLNARQWVRFLRLLY